MIPTLSEHKLEDVASAADIASMAEACAAGDAQALFAAVDRYAGGMLLQQLCTVNRYDPERIGVQRLYSSNPVAYPPGGRKDKRDTEWGRHVLVERRIFVGEGAEAIRLAFDDHEAIAALGLRSVINVPVVLAGTCLGTINFLMHHPQVTREHVACARLAAILAMPGFLAGAAS